VPEGALLSDDDIDRLVETGRAAVPERAGFDFVDLKHCHGYFGHELLSAVDRPGKLRRQLEAEPVSCGSWSPPFEPALASTSACA
jgi:hypothetical protein